MLFKCSTLKPKLIPSRYLECSNLSTTNDNHNCFMKYKHPKSFPLRVPGALIGPQILFESHLTFSAKLNFTLGVKEG